MVLRKRMQILPKLDSFDAHKMESRNNVKCIILTTSCGKFSTRKKATYIHNSQICKHSYKVNFIPFSIRMSSSLFFPMICIYKIYFCQYCLRKYVNSTEKGYKEGIVGTENAWERKEKSWGFQNLDTMSRDPMAHFDSMCLSKGSLLKTTQFADLGPDSISPETSQPSMLQ